MWLNPLNRDKRLDAASRAKLPEIAEG